MKFANIEGQDLVSWANGHIDIFKWKLRECRPPSSKTRFVLRARSEVVSEQVLQRELYPMRYRLTSVSRAKGGCANIEAA